MSKIQFQPCGRSMRWYEWVLMLLMLALVAGVRAESVYKCTDTQGTIAFQAQPCPPQQAETQVTLLPAPSLSRSPDYSAADNRHMPPAHNENTGRHLLAQPSQVSYECRVSDGEVFYRHSPCPHSVPADAARGGKNRGRGGSQSPGQKLTVSARAVSREEACAQLHRAGAIGRAGHAHDEEVTTYDRNLGRDPCR